MQKLTLKKAILGIFVAINAGLALYYIFVLAPQQRRILMPPPSASSASETPGSPDPDSIRETIASEVGAYLSSQLQSRDAKALEVPEAMERIWPDLYNVFKKYQEPQNYKLGTEEEQLIYDYLLGDASRAESTFKQLSRTLCFECMDRVWFKCKATADGISCPPDVICPVSGQPYQASITELSCPFHGQILTFPDRTPRPSLPELYPQLCMGYFTHNRTHRLDEAILRDPIASAKPGETVLDVGSGVGCYVWAMREAVGETGCVIANDVDTTVLDFIKFVAEKRGFTNVQTVHASYDYPNIDIKSVDRVYIIDVLNVMIGMEIKNNLPPSEQADSYMQKLVQAIRPKGKLVIIDFPPEGDRPHIPIDQAISFCQKYNMKLQGQRLLTLDQGTMYVLTFSADQP
ncbi:class I SAM-dependent methyltransferase [bacterium]|nr:class I SAM-dependent methyltransferase [bacterium]